MNVYCPQRKDPNKDSLILTIMSQRMNTGGSKASAKAYQNLDVDDNQAYQQENPKGRGDKNQTPQKIGVDGVPIILPCQQAHHPSSFPFLTTESTIWDVYNNEAKILDTELIKDWTSSLNFLLVFSGVFAAILTAFIIESKKLLEEDSTNLVAEILIFHMDNLATGNHTPFQHKEFLPTRASISINCLLFASLGFTIVAALASVLALQWTAHYDAVTSKGALSPVERVRRRQFKYGGIVKWKMKQIISALPVLVVFAVLLFFAGVCQWMWIVNRKVGAVILSAAVLAMTFYLFTTICTVIFPSAPYRTALSTWTYIVFRGIWQVLLIMCALVLWMMRKIPNNWFSSSRFHQVNLVRRDNAIVDYNKKSSAGRRLLPDALFWLSNTLSLSMGSRPRLLLLLEEMEILNLEDRSSEPFSKIPWTSILNAVGTPLFIKARQGNCTSSDYREIALLAKCIRNPLIANATDSRAIHRDYDFLNKLPLLQPSSPEEMEVIGCFIEWNRKRDGIEMLEYWCRIVEPVPEALHSTVIESMRLCFLLVGENPGKGESDGHRKEVHFVQTEQMMLEFMVLLDSLIVEDGKTTQHASIIGLICSILQNYMPALRGEKIDRQIDIEVKDPCISIFVAAIKGTEPAARVLSNRDPLTRHDHSWEMCLSYIFEHPNSQALGIDSIRTFVLRELPLSLSYSLWKKAFVNIKQMIKYRAYFPDESYKFLLPIHWQCQHNRDVHAIFAYITPEGSQNGEMIHFNFLLGILYDARHISNCDGLPLSQECLSYIEEICDGIRKNEGALFQLLADMMTFENLETDDLDENWGSYIMGALLTQRALKSFSPQPDAKELLADFFTHFRDEVFSKELKSRISIPPEWVEDILTKTISSLE